MASIQAGHKKGADASSVTTTPVTKPDTAPSGDLVFILMSSDANTPQVFTFDGAFTELYPDALYQSAATAVVAYKTSGGSESDYSVGMGTSERQVWICFAVTDHNGIDVSATANTGSSGTATFPAMTPTETGCLGIRVCLTDQNATSTVPFGTMSGSGWSLIDEHFGASAGGIGAWQKTLGTGGVEEASGTATLNVSEQWWAVSFAIKPAAAASGKAPILFRPRVLRVWTRYR